MAYPKGDTLFGGGRGLQYPQSTKGLGFGHSKE